MIAGDEIERASQPFRIAQLRLILLQKRGDRRLGIRVEIAQVAIAAQGVVNVAQQHVVPIRNAVPAPVQIEIHVESRFKAFAWTSPFRYERDFGKFRANLREHVLPGADRIGLAVIVMLDETVGHVHAEAIGAAGQPETHDVDHRVGGGECVRSQGGLLPSMFWMGEPVVECWLAFEEIQDVGAVAR